MHVAINVGLEMVHKAVNVLVIHAPHVAILVTVDRCARLDVLFNERLHDLFLTIRSDLGTHATLALQDTYNGSLASSITSFHPYLGLARFVHIASLATNQGFVYLDLTIQFSPGLLIL